MDPLKKYIKENREQFDDMEPSSGHFERFAARLSTTKKRKKTVHMVLLSISSAAAVVALFLLYVIPTEQPVKSYCSLSPELMEVNSHYAMEVESRVEKIQQLSQYVDEPGQQALNSSITAMRNDSSELIEQLCAANASDEENIYIVIQHYQHQIDALQTTISALE